MKQIYLFSILAFFFCSTLAAQDLIVKADRTEVKSRVLEIDDAVIKYKKFEFPDGPTYSVKKVDVFMIIYADGRKEYVSTSHLPEKKPAAGTASGASGSASNASADSSGDVSTFSLAINDKASGVDMEYNWLHLAKYLYSGVSLWATFGTPGAAGTYVYAIYKRPLDAKKNFYVWVNAGYSWTKVNSYTAGSIHVPESSSSEFLWEIGADYYFGKHFGITAYSPKANGLWAGISFRW